MGLAGLLLPGVFSEHAPHFHRILGVAAPPLLLAGIGLDWLWQRVARVTASAASPRWANAGAASLVVVLLVGAGVTSARDYFVRWAGLPDLYYAFDEGLWALGQLTDDLAEEMPVYITPQGADHATLAFAWRERDDDTQPISFDGRHVFPLTDGVTADGEAYAVIEHEDFRTRLLLPEVFPSAEVLDELRNRQGDVYARVNLRPAGSGPARARRRSTAPLRWATASAWPAMMCCRTNLRRADRSTSSYTGWWTRRPLAIRIVFTHLVDPASGQVVAGHDSSPGAGSLSTTRWRAGWRILDEYEMRLPADLPAGDYALYAGLMTCPVIACPWTKPESASAASWWNEHGRRADWLRRCCRCFIARKNSTAGASACAA